MSWEGPVALVGVALGVVNAAILGFQMWSENRVRVGVSMDLHDFGPSGYVKPGLFIEARNYGKKTVVLSSAEVWAGAGFKAQVDSDPPTFVLPHMLEGASSHEVWMDPYDLAEKMSSQGISGDVVITGSFKDQLGNTRKSEPLEFKVDDWLLSDREPDPLV